MSFFAASTFWVPLTMPMASRSQPSPSFGNTSSIGAPRAFSRLARYSKEMPTTYSPAAAAAQGREPECMYWAMFSCSASMNFQPSASPHSCSQADTSKKPVPLEAGCGMTI